MRCVVFLIFIAKLAFIYAPSPRSVNLALDTVLEFDNKNDVHFIKTLQHFLDKLKITISRSNPDMEDVLNDSEVEKKVKLNNFLTEMLTVISSFNDKELQKFIKTMEGEIKAFLDRNKISGSTYVPYYGLRRLIDSKLEEFSSLPVKDVRKKLRTISRKLNYGKRNRNNAMLADFLNYFYINESKAKISNFVKNLKIYRAQTRRGFHLNLKKIIRSGIESIIEPIMRFGATLRDLQIENEHMAKEPEKPTGSILFKDLFKNFVKETHEEDKDHEILDYIDRYKRVIDKHITTNEFLKDESDSNAKSDTKKYKTPTVTKRHIRTTKKRKYKPTYSSTEERDSKLRGNDNKRTTVKTSKKVVSDESEDTSLTDIDTDKDLSNVKEPFLIKIGSNDESTSEEEVTTTVQHTKQRRYKKFTRTQTTTKKPYYFIKTPNKYRKSLLTTASDEGLSIEQFGSMVIPKFYRKSNDNDTFTQRGLNNTRSTGIDVNKQDSTEIVDDAVSTNLNKFMTNNEADVGKTVTVPESTIHDTKSDVEKYAITKTINLKGNIFIEKPINITNQNTISFEIIRKASEEEFSNNKSLNDIQTKELNVQNIKPPIYLRSQNLNETETNTSTKITTTLFNLTTAKTSEVDVKTEEVSIKTIDDGLENELENMIDKYNTSSTFPIEFDNFLKESEMNNYKSDVQNRMKSDLSKLLGRTDHTTENAVTDMYTDPFSELDAVDLIK